MTKNPKFGDFQSNHAFRIAKMNRQNPRELATKENFSFQCICLEKIEVAGPGFMNLDFPMNGSRRKSRKFMLTKICGLTQHSDDTVVIDYSSPNGAKRMHIGHMRSTIIGNCLDRIYRAMGFRVIADNHIGDWGTQFGKLIVQWNEQVDMDHFEKDPIGELERLYVSFAQYEGEEKEEKEKMARAETAKLQSGDEENLKLWKMFINASMIEFNGVYKRLGVSFDDVWENQPITINFLQLYLNCKI